MKDLHHENYKTLMKEIKGQMKWKAILDSWSKRNNIVEMSILSAVMYKFLTEIEKESKKPHTHTKNLITKAIFNKNNKTRKRYTI
jgi:hypothetical protein